MLCNALVLSSQAIASIDWLEVVRTIASLAVAVIAFFALKNWQRQDRAKREAEFLDALVEATHAFIVEIARRIALVKMARIGMMSHVSLFDDRKDADKVAEGAVPYIKKDGERDAKRLIETLNGVRSSAIALRSLGTKGQVFGFSQYATCQNAVAVLTWQFDRIEVFATIIGSPMMNWEHPEVQRALRNVLTVDECDIQQNIGENNIRILEYARQIYTQLYGARPSRARI